MVSSALRPEQGGDGEREEQSDAVKKARDRLAKAKDLADRKDSSIKSLLLFSIDQ